MMLEVQGGRDQEFTKVLGGVHITKADDHDFHFLKTFKK